MHNGWPTGWIARGNRAAVRRLGKGNVDMIITAVSGSSLFGAIARLVDSARVEQRILIAIDSRGSGDRHARLVELYRTRGIILNLVGGSASAWTLGIHCLSGRDKAQTGWERSGCAGQGNETGTERRIAHEGLDGVNLRLGVGRCRW